MKIERTLMGLLPSAQKVYCYRMENAQGHYAEVSNLGGCIMGIHVPDKNGKLDDVVVGYNTVDGLLNGDGYMGCLIGRYGNRIGGAAFELNGKTYHVGANEKTNSLHGGITGFDKKLWQVRQEKDALVLSCVSADGEEGFPGTLRVSVTYRFDDNDVFSIRYDAQCDRDTIVNLTNHVYFNLEGQDSSSTAEHMACIYSDAITAVADSASIPTGELMDVTGTPFDLRKARRIGDCLAEQDSCRQMAFTGGFDHNYVLVNDGKLHIAARMTAPSTGRVLEAWTDQPGVQFYGGNFLGSNDTVAKCGRKLAFRQGFCLETQHYPDSPNHPEFPTTVLKKGERYITETEYRFSAE